MSFPTTDQVRHSNRILGSPTNLEQFNPRALKHTFIDPEDEVTPPSAFQVPNQQTEDNDNENSTFTVDSQYKSVLKTPIQPVPFQSPPKIASSISHLHLKELKEDSEKGFNNLCAIMTEQNSMMLNKIEHSMDRFTFQSAQSADCTVNAILAMTETLVSLIQKKNNKTSLLQNQDKTSKNEDKEEVTHNNNVDKEEDLHEKSDFYNEAYRNGYETYHTCNQ